MLEIFYEYSENWALAKKTRTKDYRSVMQKCRKFINISMTPIELTFNDLKFQRPFCGNVYLQVSFERLDLKRNKSILENVYLQE